MIFKRFEIRITGIVQGVGFRPFVYNLAKSLDLNGWVKNVGADVIIEVEGKNGKIEIFIQKLKSEAPPLSCIKGIHIKENAWSGYKNFIIAQSRIDATKNIYISPDTSICADCMSEMFNPSDRRYLYHFINCTNCGPRFTIIQNVPYDRCNTTMDKFEMCPQCAAEYQKPSDRRYHAQPVSCYQCGPRLELLDQKGCRLEPEDILKEVRGLLAKGKIIAVKGLGGYHLVCDAENAATVKELRKRKARDDKPFALMVADFTVAQRYCDISQEEKVLLESSQKPIVLLKRKTDINLPEEIAPGNPFLGVMLPYTPVHLMLLSSPEDKLSVDNSSTCSALVMTSGNRSSEPIYFKDSEAFENLKGIADYFLTNDREIYIRTDDSVTRVFKGKEYMIRRARGYVPFPVTCNVQSGHAQIPSVLACGGELKSTFCMNKGNEFYLSHHIGDLENAETLTSYEEGIEHFKRLFDIKYDTVVYDLHPEYLSTKYAIDLDIKNKIAVQHHHAHIASCMAENCVNEDVIGIAFDGTGFGEDGHLWGGEFFSGSFKGFKREGHLEYIPMPGGESAVREPWRMAISYIQKAELSLEELMSGEAQNTGGFRYLQGIDKNSVSTILQMIQKKINSPMTSSMGRLFDAAAALLGVRHQIKYEGQAAIELEFLAQKVECSPYEFQRMEVDGKFILCVEDIIRGIMWDISRNVSKQMIATKFHATIAQIVLEGSVHIRNKTGIRSVVLSGGVFQNMTLLDLCMFHLNNSGFKVFIHSKVPSNDGGIALGQAVLGIMKQR